MAWQRWIVCLGLALLALANTEIDTLDRILGVFRKLVDEYPIEKVFVHTDKQYYLAGEEIWFKTYVAQGPLQLPSHLSKVVYVDLVSASNNVIDHQTLLCEAGMGYGSIHLTDSLASGSYSIQAYTKWMQNFDSSLYFNEEVKIWNLHERISTQKATLPSSGLDVQFFPEGGNLVAATNNKIGFKAVGADGLGKPVAGTVYDEQGAKITSFKSNELGMGFFVLSPGVSQKFVAVLDSPRNFSLHLPVANDRGVSISASNDKAGNVVVEILSHSVDPSEKFFLVGHTRGTVYYAARVQLPGSRLKAKISKTKFPTGICQVTLFDQNGRPISARPVYIEHETPSITLKASVKNYMPREKAAITIEVRDTDGKPLKANLSMAVCDAQQVLLDERADNIASYFYLSSELKGHIESPAYYFNKQNADRLEALDALLLTQGWRRYLWTNAWNSNFPEIKTPPEQGFTLRGRLLDAVRNKPLADGKVTFIEGGPQGEIVIARSDKEGRFTIESLQLSDTLKSSLLAEDKKGRKEVRIELDTAVTHSAWSFQPQAFSESLGEFEKRIIAQGLRQKNIDLAYNFGEKNTLLETITIKSTKIERTPVKIYGNADAIVKSSDIPNSQSYSHPLQLLQGRVAGVAVSQGSFNSFSVTVRQGTPLVLLDDVIISMDALSYIPARSIESVVVLKGASAAIFGGQGDGGALLFYSKKMGSSGTDSSDGYLSLSHIGFRGSKEFYSPKYDAPKPEDIKPDERTVLFWSPMIKLDSTGTARVEFYNHDLATTVVVIAQGLTDTGVPLYAQTSYAIEKK